MIPPLNNRLHITAASLIIYSELFPARFPPMSTSNRDMSPRMLPGQRTRPLPGIEFLNPLKYPSPLANVSDVPVAPFP